MISAPSRSTTGRSAREVQRRHRDASRGRCRATRRARSSSRAGTRARSRRCAMRVLYRSHNSGRWFFGIPAVLRVAEGEHALLRARLLLVAARAADGRVEAALVQRLLQRLRLHHVGVHRGAVRDRADAARDAVGIGVHAQVDAGFAPRGGRGTRSSRGTSSRCPRAAAGSAAAPGANALQQQVQQHRAVLADRIQHHRVAELGRHLAQDVHALGFEAVEVARGHAVRRLCVDSRILRCPCTPAGAQAEKCWYSVRVLSPTTSGPTTTSSQRALQAA